MYNDVIYWLYQVELVGSLVQFSALFVVKVEELSTGLILRRNMKANVTVKFLFEVSSNMVSSEATHTVVSY